MIGTGVPLHPRPRRLGGCSASRQTHSTTGRVHYAGTYAQRRGTGLPWLPAAEARANPRILHVGRSLTASLQATRSPAEMENPSEAERDATDPPHGQYDPDESCRSVRGAQDHRGRDQHHQSSGTRNDPCARLIVEFGADIPTTLHWHTRRFPHVSSAPRQQS